VAEEVIVESVAYLVKRLGEPRRQVRGGPYFAGFGGEDDT
jgi:hypothetical protein